MHSRSPFFNIAGIFFVLVSYSEYSDSLFSVQCCWSNKVDGDEPNDLFKNDCYMYANISTIAVAHLVTIKFSFIHEAPNSP